MVMVLLGSGTCKVSKPGVVGKNWSVEQKLKVFVVVSVLMQMMWKTEEQLLTTVCIFVKEKMLDLILLFR